MATTHNSRPGQPRWQPGWETPTGSPAPHGPSPAHDTAGIGAGDAVTSREHWERFYDQAVHDDLEQRRQRDARPHSAATAAAALRPAPRPRPGAR